MKKNLLKSSFYRYIELLVSIVVTFTLTPFLINQLGEMDYGLWILLLSTLGWFSILSLGFPSAISREINLALEKKNDLDVNKVFSCAIVLFITLGGIASIGIFFLGVFPQVLGIPIERLVVSSHVIYILCLKVFMDFLMGSIHGIFAGYIRFDIDAKISAGTELLKGIIAFLVVEKYGLYGLVFATMITELLKNILMVYFAIKLHKTLLFSIKYVSFKEIKFLFSFSKHIIAIDLARSLRLKSDPIIVANIIDVSSITILNIASRLVMTIESAITAIVGVFRPVFVKSVANNTDITKVFLIINSLNYFVAGIFYIPFVLLADEFIYLWLGSKFSDSALLVFILSLAFITQTISRPISSLLIARAEHKMMSVINLVGAIINVLLSITLGYFYGLTGVVTATLISYVVSDVFLYTWMQWHYIKIPIDKIIIKFIVLVMLFILMYLFGEVFLVEKQNITWFMLFINSIIIFCINFVLCWILLLNNDTKEKIISIIPVYKKK